MFGTVCSLCSRPDVLVFRTSPLSADLEVTGIVSVTLYVSSSAVDTDFTAKVCWLLPPPSIELLLKAHTLLSAAPICCSSSADTPTLCLLFRARTQLVDEYPPSRDYPEGYAMLVSHGAGAVQCLPPESRCP